MQIMALATDFDGTLAVDEVVPAEALSALQDLRATGRRLVLVTGRRIEDLLRVFPGVDIFDRVVAENGCIVFSPGNGDLQELGPVSPALVEALRGRGVDPIDIGHCIVATWQPHAVAAFEAIRELGLEHQIEFNRSAVMIMPPGVTKATGLARALHQLGISPHNTAGVGDAENDHAFLNACEVGIAVANAVPSLRQAADIALDLPAGDAIVAVARQIIEDDMAAWSGRITRHDIQLGRYPGDGGDVVLPAHDAVLLIAGPTQSGKSTLAAHILGRLLDAEYQCCVVDPEGEYSRIPSLLHAGAGSTEIASEALRSSNQSVLLDLTAVPAAERQTGILRVLRDVAEARALFGRPHWLVVDEAHHMLYVPFPERAPGERTPPLRNAVLVTMLPDNLDPRIQRQVTHVAMLGPSSEAMLGAFCRATGAREPRLEGQPTGEQGLFWRVGAPVAGVFEPSFDAEILRRHERKYAFGDLGAERAFVFTGEGRQTRTPARNLAAFVDVAEAVSLQTWAFHLKRRDFARWFRDCVHDPQLAATADELAARGDVPAEEGRRHLLGAIIARYAIRTSDDEGANADALSHRPAGS